MINCAIVKDLLPLYADSVLSKESQELVREHLESCKNCKREFANMRSEIIKPQPGNEDIKIKVMKSANRKIFRQKMMAAAASCLLVMVIAIIGIYFLFHHVTPVTYEPGRVWVEMRTIETMGNLGLFGMVDDYAINYYNDGTTKVANVLDFTSSGDFFGIANYRREININGVYTEIILVSVSQTLSTRWWPDYDRNWSFRIAAVGENESPSLPIRVYYVDEMPTRARYLLALSDEKFLAKGTNGTLLWSGTLESPR